MSFLQRVFRRGSDAHSASYSFAEASSETDFFADGYSITADYLGSEVLPDGMPVKPAFPKAQPVVERYFDDKTSQRITVSVTETSVTLTSQKTGKKVEEMRFYQIGHIGTHDQFHRAVWIIEKSRKEASRSQVICHVLRCKTPKAAAALLAVLGKAFQNLFNMWQKRRQDAAKAASALGDSSKTLKAATTPTAGTASSDEESDDGGSISNLIGFVESEQGHSAKEAKAFLRRASLSGEQPDLLFDVAQSKTAGDALHLSFAEFMKFLSSAEDDDVAEEEKPPNWPKDL